MVEKRGRKSVADSLEIVPLMSADAKPQPPADMVDSEAVIWRSIVDACPPRWFGRESWPVLRGLCKHQAAADLLGREYGEALADLAAAKNKKEKSAATTRVDMLAKMYYRETHAVRHHSADLRLTKITRIGNQISAERKKQHTALKKPWEI
jgi:hypothetical protein